MHCSYIKKLYTKGYKTMGLYDEFRFRPAPYLPHSNLPLEEL